jgi:hypothetical protein
MPHSIALGSWRVGWASAHVFFALMLLSPVLAIPRRVPARLPGNFLLLAQKKVTKEKSPEFNFNLAKRLSGKELTTFDHRAHRPNTEPKLGRCAASYSLSAGWCADRGLANQEYEAAQRRSLGKVMPQQAGRYPVVRYPKQRTYGQQTRKPVRQ